MYHIYIEISFIKRYNLLLTLDESIYLINLFIKNNIRFEYFAIYYYMDYIFNTTEFIKPFEIDLKMFKYILTY